MSEGRTISAAVSIPQWMKDKMNRFDFEQSAFSPTEIDDSYLLHYRYQRGVPEPKETNNNSAASLFSQNVSNKHYQPDVSKYTAPCQKFLKDGNECATAQQVVHPIQAKTKSSGIDDGFKGEAAKCGVSIIKVAQQMVSGKISPKVDFENKDISSSPGTPPGHYQMIRRGSKSLPASPLTSPKGSPKSQRRINKYFTGPFVDADKNQGWILSNFLAKRTDSIRSVDTITEEEEKPHLSTIESKSDIKKNNVFKPKPSELREMNFWSPTSM